MFDQLNKRVQLIGDTRFIIVNSQTSKTKRSWLDRMFSRPFQKYNYEHHELIVDDKFYTGNLGHGTVTYCNQRTFNKLKAEMERREKNETVRTR